LIHGLIGANFNRQEIAAAAIYLVCKPGTHPVEIRPLLTAIQHVANRPSILTSDVDAKYDAESSFFTEGTYTAARASIVNAEAQVLRVLGFQTHVALPHALCINYMQTLDALTEDSGHHLARRAFEHLNAALLNPQLLYLTHQPNELATSAIYLAAKEVGVKLPENEWWEVFDVDREELGFVVVALTSMAGFAEEEARKWGRRKVPLTVADVQAELERRRMLETGG